MFDYDNLTLVGEGTTRDTYLHPDYPDTLVIKRHLHPIGYLQSKMEKQVWDNANPKWRQHFTEIHEVTEEYQVCALLLPYNATRDSAGNFLDWDEEYLPFKYTKCDNGFSQFIEHETEILEYLVDLGVETDELFHTSNCAVVDSRLVFIDYGMQTHLYEEFCTEQELGNIRQYLFENCPVCGRESNVMYYKGEAYPCEKCKI